MADEHGTLAQRERAAIVESFRAVGPDAPTLCEGWTTRDLAAHLVVREGRPDLAAGVLIPPLAGRLEEVRRQVAAKPWDELLGTVAAGAPWFSPFRYADRLANAAEYLVHHEDVRRATQPWTPRAFGEADLDWIWNAATMMARSSLRRVPARIELRTPVGMTLPKGKAVNTGAKLTPMVTVVAAPVELLLWAFGRDEVEVDISGAEEGVALVEDAKRGL